MIAVSSHHHQDAEIYEPAPEEILEACREIQSHWGPADYLKRSVAPNPINWQVPEIAIPQHSLKELTD